MTPERDIERALETWLEPGASKMPDRLFDAVVDRIERVPQRRFVWTHTRFTAMTPMLKFAAVAALALAVGIGVAPLSGNHTTQVPASPAPSGSPSPAPIPEGIYTTVASSEVGAALGWEKCSLTPDGEHLKLEFKSGNRWSLTGPCGSTPDGRGNYGAYTATADRLVLTGVGAVVTADWSLRDDILTLRLVDSAGTDASPDVYRFLLDHTWTPDAFVVDHTFPVRIALNLPARWSQASLQPGVVSFKKTLDGDVWPAWLEFWQVSNVYADPCQSTGGPMSPAVGPTVDDLTQALTHQAGFSAGPVTDVTIGGFAGKQFDLDNGIDITKCSGNPWLDQWTSDASPSEPGHTLDGAHQRIAIVDVGGTRVLAEVVTWWSTSAADEEEADRVMDSVRFEMPASSLTP